MKGLRLYLTPFAPDQSGAVSVLYEAGGMIVILDAGGCTGNVCGFDEPRWFEKRSCVFSAGLRDMDAILGRDRLLVRKIKEASERIEASFVAIIGTPVPAVIGTDYQALRRMLSKQICLPVLTVPANGMELYDKGARKAYLEMFQVLACQTASDHLTNTDMLEEGNGSAFENHHRMAGILGEIPLDLIRRQDAEKNEKYLKEQGYDDVLHYGMGAGAKEIAMAGYASMNLVVSPSGLAAAKYLQKTFGTPYEIGYPALKEAVAAGMKMSGLLSEKETEVPAGFFEEKKVLIVHQQAVTGEFRKTYAPDAHCATWFMMEKDLSQEGDRILRDEDDFIHLVKDQNYDVIIADPVHQDMIPDYDGIFLPLPHFAVSGQSGYK